MRDYILEEKNSIYIIDLGLTVDQLQNAADFLKDLLRGGKKVLFVGTKKQAQRRLKKLPNLRVNSM